MHCWLRSLCLCTILALANGLAFGGTPTPKCGRVKLSLLSIAQKVPDLEQLISKVTLGQVLPRVAPFLNLEGLFGDHPKVPEGLPKKPPPPPPNMDIPTAPKLIDSIPDDDAEDISKSTSVSRYRQNNHDDLGAEAHAEIDTMEDKNIRDIFQDWSRAHSKTVEETLANPVNYYALLFHGYAPSTSSTPARRLKAPEFKNLQQLRMIIFYLSVVVMSAITSAALCLAQ